MAAQCPENKTPNPVCGPQSLGDPTLPDPDLISSSHVVWVTLASFPILPITEAGSRLRAFVLTVPSAWIPLPTALPTASFLLKV